MIDISLLVQKETGTFDHYFGDKRVFGRLTLIKYVGHLGKRDCWEVKCECGTSQIVRGFNLRSGNTKSCGCIVRKQICVNGHDTFECGRSKANGACNECKSIVTHNWYENSKNRILADAKEYYLKHRNEYKIRITKWREDHPQEVIDHHRQHYIENRSEILLKKKKHRKEHPEVYRALDIKQDEQRKLRIVAWTDWDRIDEFERCKPEGMTSDHIIPLRGKKVAGLHVSWNLQYMPGNLNSSKNNKIDLFWASEWYGKILEEIGLKDKN